MNRILFALFILSFCACSNELDLTASYQDIPVVYGLISPQDTAHYLRIERGFIDEEIAPDVIAQNPDSLYYEDVMARLTRVSNGQSIEFIRVDGNDEGYPREDGAFANAPNYLYKIN